MASSSSISTVLSPTQQTLPSSQLLSSSISSLATATSSRQASVRQASSQISKIYRQSSTLFLTRRLPESLSTILPVITPPVDQDAAGKETGEPAPVVQASRTTRIKVWSLYLTILNAVLELDPDEGKQAFGSADYRGLVNKVRDGQVWEEVVKNGYGGIQGDVDSDVVINLATLLLAHGRSQKVNQTRLEQYLAESSHPKLDISARLEAVRSGARSPTKSGTNTPRDLNSRVKVLELYTLHVLLRNNEWEFSRQIISESEILDEERREAFLQAFGSLQDEQEELKAREKEQLLYQEEVRKHEERERRMREEEERERGWQDSSEQDYGVEDTPPNNGSVKARSTTGSTSGQKRVTSSPTARSSKPVKKVAAPTLVTRASNIINNLRAMLDGITTGFAKNPLVLLRIMAFIVAFLTVFGQRQIRERIKRVLGQGWTKVRQTAGMGVKVSYI